MPADTIDGWEYGDGCPNCDNDRRFGETCESHGTVLFNEEGDIEWYEQNQMGEPLIVQCTECDTVLMDKINGIDG